MNQFKYACPVCKQILDSTTDNKFFVCHHDKIKFPKDDGIPVLIPNQSKPLEEN